MSVIKRIGELFRERIGEVVSKEELQTVASPATEWSRRVRDLRAEGWKISSHNDRNDLKPGEYVLEEEPPDKSGYKFAKPISGRLRAEVLTRNGHTCQMCGIGAGELDEETGHKARLHVGHIVDRSHGGLDIASNLRTLCSRCNEGAKNIVQEPPSHAWLMSQIRRATEADQLKALEWLEQKFQRRPSAD